MNTKKHLQDNKSIRAATKKLIRKIGLTASAEMCGVSISLLSLFINDKRRMTIERVVEIYERLQ